MSTKLPMLLLFLSAVLWGIAIPVFKLAPHIPLFSYALIRFLIAAVIFVPLYLQNSHYQPVKVIDLPKMFLVGFTGITLNIGFLYLGLVRTNAIDTAIIIDLAPLIAIFSAAHFLKEPILKRQLLGSCIAFTGALIIIGQPLFQTKFGASSHVVGNLFIVVSVLANDWFNILSRKLFTIYTAFTITAYLFIVGVITFLPLAIWEYTVNPHWVYTVTRADILSVTYYAIFGSILAYFFYEYGLAKAGIQRATITDYMIPVITITVSIVFLHEVITLPFIIGTALVAAGVFYSVHLPTIIAKQRPTTMVTATPLGNPTLSGNRD